MAGPGGRSTDPALTDLRGRGAGSCVAMTVTQGGACGCGGPGQGSQGLGEGSVTSFLGEGTRVPDLGQMETAHRRCGWGELRSGVEVEVV